MLPLQNRQVRLAARPFGEVKRADFEFSSSPVPELKDGEALVKVMYLSLDPAMRGWMNEGKSYIPPVRLGEVMRAGGVGRIVESRDPSLAIGDAVLGMTGAQEYAVLPAKSLKRVDPTLAPLPRYLGALGASGMTAYFGLLDICHPQPGETVVISGAAGSVGSVAGQIAKILGCRTVGIAGGEEKCRYLVEELGFDAAINYKTEYLRKALKQNCPSGINVFFDNVGGETLDAALSLLALGGRVALCGAISQYNSTTGVKGPQNYLALIARRARMEGFVLFDYEARYAEAAEALARWAAEGKIKAKEDTVSGLDQFPETLLKLFHGKNFGKLVLQIAPE